MDPRQHAWETGEPGENRFGAGSKKDYAAIIACNPVAAALLQPVGLWRPSLHANLWQQHCCSPLACANCHIKYPLQMAA